jgi:hypothetical protein
VTALQDLTSERFRRAIFDFEDELGYPRRVAFVSEDDANVDTLIQRDLDEGQAVAIAADGGIEILIEPTRRAAPVRFLDHMLGRRKVRVRWRQPEAGGAEYAARTFVGREPLAELRREAARFA